MFIGNVCYVTSAYNQVKFRLLLEEHFKKPKGSRLSNELLEQCFAAYLACRDDSSTNTKVLDKAERLIKNLNLEISDKRDYENVNINGNPEDALRAFNKLSLEYLNSNELRR